MIKIYHFLSNFIKIILILYVCSFLDWIWHQYRFIMRNYFKIHYYLGQCHHSSPNIIFFLTRGFKSLTIEYASFFLFYLFCFAFLSLFFKYLSYSESIEESLLLSCSFWEFLLLVSWTVLRGRRPYWILCLSTPFILLNLTTETFRGGEGGGRIRVLCGHIQVLLVTG